MNKKFTVLMNGIAETVINSTDEEIINEVESEGLSVTEEANRIRGNLMKCITKKDKWENAKGKMAHETDHLYYSGRLNEYMDDAEIESFCFDNKLNDDWGMICKELLLYHVDEVKIPPIDPVDWVESALEADEPVNVEEIFDKEMIALIDRINEKLATVHTHVYEATNTKVL